jgi:hypothetical protein
MPLAGAPCAAFDASVFDLLHQVFFDLLLASPAPPVTGSGTLGGTTEDAVTERFDDLPSVREARPSRVTVMFGDGILGDRPSGG